MSRLHARILAGALSLLAATTAFSQTAEEATPKRWRDPVLPLAEIIGFDILVNRVNRCCGTDSGDYAVTMDSIRRNLHSSWTVDSDPFKVNQLGHPYQGSMYYGFARSAASTSGSRGLRAGGQRAVGDRGRDHAALAQRHGVHRHRRHLPRRVAVPHGQPDAGKGWRHVALLARDGGRGGLAFHRLQPLPAGPRAGHDLQQPRAPSTTAACRWA
jgi:hypothetical protein